MKLDELQPSPGTKKNRKRRGCGPGSGLGKTAGKGHKGQRARSGSKIHPWFEGGQMPLQRRVPKRGFTNVNRKEYQVVNVEDLVRVEGGDIDIDGLRTSGLARRKSVPVKLLGNGKIDRALKITVHACSKTAKEMIEKAGGEVRLIKA